MAKEYNPVTFFAPGGSTQDANRDFSPRQVNTQRTADSANPTAQQMVDEDYVEVTPEIVDPKDPPVTAPVELQKPPPQKVNKVTPAK